MKSILKTVIFSLIFLCLFRFWCAIIYPNTSIFDGRNENSYMNYAGVENLPDGSLDYVAIGSSNIYLDVNPVEILENYGIIGCNYTAPTQPLYISYYYLCELLKQQKPKVVFLDCFGITYMHAAWESYAHLALDYFPLNREKQRVINKLPYNTEEFYFPFTLYHSRWNSLYKSDFIGLQYDKNEDFLGYVPTTTIVECGMPLLSIDLNEKFEIPEDNRKALDDIRELCNTNSIELVLIKTPNASWTINCSDACEEYANQYGIPYIDFNGYKSPVDIDIKMDFCDGGAHLNIYGANKVSNYLGLYLKENYGILDKSKENDFSYFQDYGKRLNHYLSVFNMKQIQDFKSYVDILDDNYYVLIAGRNDENSQLITEYLEEKYKCNINSLTYSGIVDGDDIVIEKSSDGISYIEKKMGNDIFYLETNNKEEKRPLKIQINYQNYAKDGIFDVVVYDKIYNEVVDTFCIQNDEMLSIYR